MGRLSIMLAGLYGATAVAAAAAAAHAGLDPVRLAQMQGAVQMQGWHALALLGCGAWAPRGGRLARAAGLAFALGTLLFCGAVYALVFAGVHLGPLAPAGGMILMLGWLLLAASGLRATA